MMSSEHWISVHSSLGWFSRRTQDAAPIIDNGKMDSVCIFCQEIPSVRGAAF